MVRKAGVTAAQQRRSKSSSFANPIFFDSPSAFGDWLSANHDSKTEVFIGYYKKHTGKQVMNWSQAVDVALCWGWIDSQAKGIDADRSAQRFTPRKTNSHWSRINVNKVASLEATGRMREPGRAAFAKRTEANTAQMSFERDEALVLSDEFAARLAADKAAAAYLAARPPGYKRQAFHWVMSAKRDETRERRLAELIERSAQQLHVKHLRPSK